MASTVLYPQEKVLHKQELINRYIPFMADKTSKYEVGRLYYSAYWDEIFKVIRVEYAKDGELNSVEVEYLQANDDIPYKGVICTELTLGDMILRPDPKKIRRLQEMVNTGIPYYGAEIVYWFYMRKIKFNDKRYGEFWPYVDHYSNKRINDWQRYYLYGEESEKGEFYNVKVLKTIRGRH